jgi:cellulose biosynthesis protein BcsQ
LSAEEPVAFAVLAGDAAGEEVAAALRNALAPGRRDATVFLPTSRGLAFFDAPPAQARQLDSDWAASVPPSARPVFVAFDEPGLEDWIPGLDALLFIAVPGPERQRSYAPWGGQVRTVVTADPRRLADFTIATFNAEDYESPFGGPATTLQGPAPEGPQPGAELPAPGPAPGDSPFLHLEHRLGPTLPPRPLAVPPSPELAVRLPASLRRLVTRERHEFDPGLAAGLLEVAPLVVVVASRKGGVGKTASAAGIAVVGGIAADARGARAALVDGNIGNPAAWGDLNVPGDAATVRAVISHLNSNLEPPVPAYANTPGLACYREDRLQADGYALDEVRRLRQYLCRRHALVVVDMPNRLPGPQSAEGEVAGHWLAQADVVVLPTDAGPEGMLGVEEYLDELEALGRRPGGRAIPAVVCFLAPQSREVRSNSKLRASLDALAVRAAAVVHVPRDEKAVLALWTERSITQVSPRLRRAYSELTKAVFNAART